MSGPSAAIPAASTCFLFFQRLVAQRGLKIGENHAALAYIAVAEMPLPKHTAAEHRALALLSPLTLETTDGFLWVYEETTHVIKAKQLS